MISISPSGSGIPPRPRARAAERLRHVISPPCCQDSAGWTKRPRSDSGRSRSSRYASQFHQSLAGDLTALGRYDEAEAAVRKAIELQPQSTIHYKKLAILQILRGKSGAAVESAKKETDPSFRTYALALAHFANGDQAEADAAKKN